MTIQQHPRTSTQKCRRRQVSNALEKVKFHLFGALYISAKSKLY